MPFLSGSQSRLRSCGNNGTSKLIVLTVQLIIIQETKRTSKSDVILMLGVDDMNTDVET